MPVSGGEDPMSQVRQMLRELLVGRENADGFFCLCVSVLGHNDTRTHFLPLIQPLATVHNGLHTTLTSIYFEYFSKDEDDELAVALALSLLEVKGQQQTDTKSLFPDPKPQGQTDTQATATYRPQNSSVQSQSVSHNGSSSQPPPAPLPKGVSYAQLAAAGGRRQTQAQHQDSTSPRGSSGHGSSPQTERQRGPTQTQRQTDIKWSNLTQDVCASIASSLTSNLNQTKDDVNVEEYDVDQSEKPKRSKNRRQRRKGYGQQVVGVPRCPSAPPPVLLWFRRDLRLHDNPAVIGSLEAGGPVIPVFIWCPEEEEGPGVTVAMGGACKFWLHQALSCLSSALERIGGHLVFLRPDVEKEVEREGVCSSLRALRSLVRETGAQTVLASALYEPWLRERDQIVVSALQRDRVEVNMVHSYCLRDPYTVTTEGVGLRGIGSVSHFMSCCQMNPGPGLGVPLDPPISLPSPSVWPRGCPLEELGLARMPCRKDGTTIDWAANIRSSWDFSEEGAQSRLEAFLNDGVYKYEKESGRADAPNTSCLSPYLHFGQLSARWLLWDAKGARCRPPKFIRKLAWRDLAYWQLTLFPDLPWESLRPSYKALRWSSERGHLKAWQRGRTGYPLVDAAMRQLWLTGWMNNYMRHVVASFLIAYLHLPWQEGYRWFQSAALDVLLTPDQALIPGTRKRKPRQKAGEAAF